jgi:hypothetical protein
MLHEHSVCRTVGLLTLLLLLLLPPPAQAKPPANKPPDNDTWQKARQIDIKKAVTGGGWRQSISDVYTATRDASDPVCEPSEPSLDWSEAPTVWYRVRWNDSDNFVAINEEGNTVAAKGMRLEVNTSGSDADTLICVYIKRKDGRFVLTAREGMKPQSLSSTTDDIPYQVSKITFGVKKGQDYYVMVMIHPDRALSLRLDARGETLATTGGPIFVLTGFGVVMLLAGSASLAVGHRRRYRSVDVMTF